MKKNKLFINIVSLLLVLCTAVAFCAFSAFAEGEDEIGGSGENVGEPGITQTEPPVETLPPEEPVQQEAVETEPPAETTPPANEPLYEYIYGYDEDVTSGYEAPKYLEELPQVGSSEVVEATAVAIPDVAVSDSTMFSGILIWLCVALGIAVIVGVMVSKRTRRRGA